MRELSERVPGVRAPASRTVLVRRELLTLEAFGRAAGLHPELVRRLVALGVLDAARDADGELRLPPSQLVAAARMQRLRAGFGLNWASVGLVMDLLDRINELEAALRRRPPNRGEASWTRTA
jgi:hypothetical protein